MSTISLRPALASEAAQIAVVQYEGWRHAYSSLLPPDHWLTDTLERRTQRWTERLTNPEEGFVWPTVAVVDGKVVGFAKAGTSRVQGGFEPINALELWALYVAPQQHGSSAASQLLNACLPDESPAELWVVDPNPRAQAFYTKHGFKRDGATFTYSDGLAAGLTVVRMLRG